MKKNKTITLGCLVAFLCSPLALAEEEGKKGDRRAEWREKMIERFDKDGDGELSDAEKTLAREEMKSKHAEYRKKMLDKFDTNKDGELSEDERKAAREQMREKYKAMKDDIMEKFDEDGDGSLSEDEREGVRDYVKENYPEMARRMHYRKKCGKGGCDKEGKGRGPKPEADE